MKLYTISGTSAHTSKDELVSLMSTVTKIFEYRSTYLFMLGRLKKARSSLRWRIVGPGSRQDVVVKSHCTWAAHTAGFIDSGNQDLNVQVEFLLISFSVSAPRSPLFPDLATTLSPWQDWIRLIISTYAFIWTFFFVWAF